MRLGLLLLALLPAGPAVAGTLVVEAQGIASVAGQLKVAVCSGSLDEAGCKLGASRRPAAAVEEFVFEGLAPGRYVVAVYHDLNGNGRLDKMPPGLPTEPYGFSNDVGRWGPPRFSSAAVEVGAERTIVIVQVRPLIGTGATWGTDG